MDKIQIEWGNLDRTEAIEQAAMTAAEKILSRAPAATNLIVHFKITNPVNSAGVKAQKVTMELRLPNHQDIHSEKEGDDLYRTILDAEKAIMTQLQAKKSR